jgi:CRISPR-associated protein Cpf1
MANLFDFTKLYSLTKTLRFELKPLGRDGKLLDEKEATNIFESIIEQDKKIKDAYTAIKPVMDKIHEFVINESLISIDAKNIDFSGYFNEYCKDKKVKNKKNESRNKIAPIEKSLRAKIGGTFAFGANLIYKKAGTFGDDKKKEKPIFKAKKEEGLKCLTAAGILKYIKKYANELEEDENKRRKLLEVHLPTVEKFFTHFQGYNQNRGNYYEVKEEKSTAVATRIVHENLPKFCDNCIQFETGKKQKNKSKKNIENIGEVNVSRREEYLNIYSFLKKLNRNTQIKDAQTGNMIDAYPISEKMFEIGEFSNCLSQSGIEEYNKTIGHYNFLINLYNQAKKDEENFDKLDPFKTLFKQIGCGKRKPLFFALMYDTKAEQEQARQDNKQDSDIILNLEETLLKINNIGKKYFGEKSKSNEIKNIPDFVEWLKLQKDWEGIYWSKKAVDFVSNKYLANWYEIQERLQIKLQDKDKKDDYKAVATYNKRREEQLKLNEAVELSGLFELLDSDSKERGWSTIFFKKSVLENDIYKIDENLTPSQNLINLIRTDMTISSQEFCKVSDEILKIENYKDDNNKTRIKDWLDYAANVVRTVKNFSVSESKVKGNSINPEISNALEVLLHSDDAQWLKWYDTIRNYLTKKPQDDAKKNKLKLNFNNSTLLDGWDVNKEPDNTSVLLRKNGLYYLVIMNKEHNKVFGDNKADGIGYEKIEYKLLPGANKMLPKVFFSKSRINEFKPSKQLLENYKNDTHKKGYNFNIKHCRNLIDFFKTSIAKHEDWAKFNFHFSDTSTYEDLSGFYREVEQQGYKITFRNISEDYINRLIDEGKIYLFQIYNKDFSPYSKGTPNMHTLYWKALFDEKNLKDATFKLNGMAEIFYRKKIIDEENKVVHPKGKPIDNKNANNVKRQSIFDYDIIKDRRYTKEYHFQFHCPITLNFKAGGNKNVNDIINSSFSETNNIQFLGIDRGEKHLIYYTLSDVQENILDQDNFDRINGKDYLVEINKAADARKTKRQNWHEIGNIKDLKDGYISLVIHEIIEKMKDGDGIFKPTFIVLEYLSKGFKRGRQKFEKQVYQKFELALAKKLNYLVNKNIPVGIIGSVSNALQLTPPVQNFQDIEGKKQIGIMLYTRANYTSVTDPVTGWRKTIYLKNGSEGDIKKQILNTFSEIGMDKNGDYFFEYKDNVGKIWTLWSSKNGKSLERYRFKRGNSKKEDEIILYKVKEDFFDKLFKDFDKKKSLLVQLENGVKLSKVNNSHTAWESLRFAIDIIQQIRNSGDTKKGQDDNFLISPVRNEQGKHFDSREYQKSKGHTLPKDGDANGAYNIARKGIIMYEHIKQWIRDGRKKYNENDKTDDLDLFVSDEEWDLWLSDRPKWKEKLQFYASRKQKDK